MSNRESHALGKHVSNRAGFLLSFLLSFLSSVFQQSLIVACLCTGSFPKMSLSHPVFQPISPHHTLQWMLVYPTAWPTTQGPFHPKSQGPSGLHCREPAGMEQRENPSEHCLFLSPQERHKHCRTPHLLRASLQNQ